MFDYPRSYYRIDAFLRNYESYKQLISDYERNNLKTPQKRQELLDVIKVLYVFYWKTLRDFFKEKGTTLFLPREILKQAQEERMINDADVWINYIDMLNRLCLEPDSETQIEIANRIFHTSRHALPLTKKSLEKRYLEMKSGMRIRGWTRSFPYNKPDYTPEDIGISETSYGLLMKFFKNCSEIKYVWLHGSRAKGKTRPNTDLDFIIDSPLQTFEDIQNTITKVRVPYWIDCENLNNKENDAFITKVSTHARMVYRAEDFRTPS